LRALAITATQRILEKSELKDLWQESEEYYSKWEQKLHNLLSRLNKGKS